MASAVPGKVVQRPFGQISFSAYPVHDLEVEPPLELAAADRVDDEPEILDRFPVEAEAIQRPEHERRVPDPGEPVVPVGPNLNTPADRSRSAPNTLGESGRGRHSHSTDPFGEIRQLCSQLDSKA
jgi:hypothetical protein